MSVLSPAEKAVYSILRLSVVAALVIIIIGLGSFFLKIAVSGGASTGSGSLSFTGLDIWGALRRLSTGDPVGIAWVAIISLILGVVLSVASSAYYSYRSGDRVLAVVSMALLLIIAISATVGLIVRSTR